jgi:hypothetical protein
MPGVDLIFYTLPEMAEAISKADLWARSHIHYRGYRNQYHDLDIQYALWEFEPAAGVKSSSAWQEPSSSTRSSS